MSHKTRLSATTLALLLSVFFVGSANTADLATGLKAGTPDLKSAGPLAFGPEGILFVGDPAGAAIFAIDTGDRKRASSGSLGVEGINDKIAALLGTTSQEIMINDLAVNPASGKAYLSVARGRTPDAPPVLLRVDGSGKIEDFSLANVKFSKATLSNAPATEKQRLESITDLAFIDGKVFVAGLTNEEFASKLRAIPYPFGEANNGSSVEIYHGSHGQFETRSPVRTFVDYTINNEPYLLAAYTCTPLVKVPIAQLKPGMHVKGITVAELGNRNRPLDMVVFQKDGKDFILMANNSRGVMKITTQNIDKIESITARVPTTAGLTYETVEHLKGVQQLDRWDKDHALILVRTEAGALNLQTIPLP